MAINPHALIAVGRDEQRSDGSTWVLERQGASASPT
jgi:hypothetical protein